MQPLTWRKDSKLLESPLLDLRMGSAFLLTKGRNAWRSTWVSRYQGSHAVHSTLEAAKADAESQRGPGNVFYVREMPVLMLETEDETQREYGIVLTDFYSDDPFGRWSPHESGSILELATPIGAVLNAFSAEGAWFHPSPNPHSLIVARASQADLAHSRLRGEPRRLHSWTSRPRGVSLPLDWTKEGNEYVYDGVTVVEQMFRSVNSEERIEQRRSERMQRDLKRLKEDLRLLESWQSPDQDRLI